jgi:hypothetical protein
MVIQTQTVGAARKALCSFYSINNAMQIYDFVSVDVSFLLLLFITEA